MIIRTLLAGWLAKWRAIRLWLSAETLPELGELTARWVAGELPLSATYGGPPDPETADIARTLIAINRAGALTIESQPGWTGPCRAAGQHVRQRALVLLYVPTDRAPELRTALTDAGMWVIEDPKAEPLVIEDGRYSSTYRVGNPLHHLTHISRKAARALDDATWLLLIDPVMGREDSPLWNVLDNYANGVRA
jgi:uncharacterized protein DUF6919